VTVRFATPHYRSYREWRSPEPCAAWRTLGSWIFFVQFDGDDEQGDPSGLWGQLCGWEWAIYWPMHRHVQWGWGLGHKPYFQRW
jgi:hypothetical protein